MIEGLLNGENCMLTVLFYFFDLSIRHIFILETLIFIEPPPEVNSTITRFDIIRYLAEHVFLAPPPKLDVLIIIFYVFFII